MTTQPSLTPNTPVKRKPELMIATIDNEIVMMDASQSKYFGIQGAGTRIWELLAEPTTPLRIANTLSQELNVDHDTAHRDTMEFLESLYSLRLITLESE